MNLLGEAYAFGVVWSFFLKSLGVLVLRYQRHDQEYKVPVNFHIGGREIPVGLVVTTLILFLVAIANLFSKQIATIYGVCFTIVLFVMFTISEQHQPAQESTEKKRSRGVQPRHAAGDHHRDRPRAARLRAGGRARLQPHDAPAQRAAKRPTCDVTTSW